MFCEEIGLEGARSLTDILARAQPYINYEEKPLVEEVERGRGSGNPMNSRLVERDFNRSWDERE